MNKYIEGRTFDIIYAQLCGGIMYTPDYRSTTKDGHSIKEYINPTFMIKNPLRCFAVSRGMSLKYLEGELDWYISGSPYLEDILPYSKFWKNVSDDGRTIRSNYGKILLHDRNHSNFTQYEYAEQCLWNNKDSKKAVMVIYSPEDARKSKDNPCTMFLQFFIRDNALHLFVKMRSSDMWFGLPYDVPFFSYIQQIMLKDLRVPYPELELGTYTHNAGSLHIYERNEELLYKRVIHNHNSYKWDEDEAVCKKLLKERVDKW